MAEQGATREQVMTFIEEYIEVKKLPPTRREIAGGVNICLSCVQFHIDSLVQDGLLRRIPNTARGLIPT